MSRFEKTVGAKPNAAHTALATLEAWQAKQAGELLVITQNIDGLHRQAGSRNLVEVHGRADRVRCPRLGCPNGAPAGSLARSDFDLTEFLAKPCQATLPRCPRCQAVLRQHVLWFDEYYDSHRDYQWARVLESSATADAVLFVGTSFSVGVTELVLQTALQERKPVLSIDPAATALIAEVIALKARAEEILPAVCEQLIASQ